jgi:hypothetical protein
LITVESSRLTNEPMIAASRLRRLRVSLVISVPARYSTRIAGPTQG